MTEPATRIPNPQREEDSQLGLFRRILLYARKPRDAFAITSIRERRVDAVWVFALYFAVKTPVLVQRAAALGRIEKLGVAASAVAIGLGLVGAVVLSLVAFTVLGAILHLVLNLALHAGRTFGDAVQLPVLSLAPQLLLVLEYPSLILDFRAFDTFALFALLRIVVDVLSWRAFYWGLRKLFGLSAARAMAVALVLAAPIALLTLAVIARLAIR
jgi:hypothetical protein